MKVSKIKEKYVKIDLHPCIFCSSLTSRIQFNEYICGNCISTCRRIMIKVKAKEAYFKRKSKSI